MNDTQRTSANIANGRIGAVLSGGGSRATSFHLGMFEYLDRCGLLSRLRMLSTVSGGTFIGAKYALCLAHGQDFAGFFRDFYHDLLDTRALADSLGKLADLPPAQDGYAVPSRRRDLIICAAQTYAETFLRCGGAPRDGAAALTAPCPRCGDERRAYRLGDVLEPPADYPLEEVVFNTTEYRTGVAFRFQRNGRLGNINVCPPPDKVECWNCASIVDAPASIKGTCSNVQCAVELRTCRQCAAFDLDTGCGEAAVIHHKLQVEDTEEANSCEWFDSRPVSDQALDRMRAESADIRIADVVAASSCLPGIFGPLGFPDDFAWPAGKVPDTIRSVFEHHGRPRPLTLMDGGIYDNQGIESLMLADRRIDRDTLTHHVLSSVLGEGRGAGQHAGAHRDGPPEPRPSRLDVLIVSDADRREDDILEYDEKYVDPGAPVAPRGLQLGTLNMLAWVLMVVCFVAALVAAADLLDALLDRSSDWLGYLLGVVSLVLAAGTAKVLLQLRRGFDKLREGIPQNDATTWKKIKKIRIGSLEDSLLLGYKGVRATVNAVMPKRMRELGYWIFYSDPHYHGKRLSNLIYHLQSGDPRARLRMWEFLDRHGLPTIGSPTLDDREVTRTPAGGTGPDLQAIIDKAAAMDTRFWFKPEEGEPERYRGRGELDRVLVCGQATTCFNLMKYVERIHGSDPGKYPQEVAELWTALTSDWRALHAAPYSLLDERLGRVGIPVPETRT